MEIVSLFPSFDGTLYTLVAFVIALSIIVTVHEFGHYIVARWSGIHAEVFSLGFGPALLARTDRFGTRWQLAALPFGGYVKFLGDSDATSARGDEAALAHMDAQTRRRSIHGAPLWARAATVLAGPAFNFLLSIVVFTAFFLARGVVTDTPVVGELKPMPSPVQELMTGDRILSVGGVATPDSAAFGRVADTLQPTATVPYTVMRDDTEILVHGPFPFPPLVDGLQPGSAAMDAGIQAGDVILAVDGAPIYAFGQLRDRVVASDGKALLLSVWRSGATLDVTLIPRRVDLPNVDGGFETRWLIGITGSLFFAPQTRTPGPVEALSMGVSQIGIIVRTSLSGLWHMATGKISLCNLRGPIGIAETSGAAASQGLATFIWFIAMLSTAVGLLNLFPVPILDGGHLVFHAWEALRGRPPSDKALSLLMGAGLLVIGAVMALAFSNDLFCQ